MKLFIFMVVMVGAGVMFGGTAMAQKCKERTEAVSVYVTVTEHNGTRELTFKLQDNKTFNSLMGGGNPRDLNRALSSAKTIDGRPLVPERGKIDIEKSTGQFYLNEGLSLSAAQEVLETVFKYELFPCGRNGPIKWRGDFDPRKTEYARAHKID